MEILVCDRCYGEGKKINEAVEIVPSITLPKSGRMTKQIALCQTHFDAMGFVYTKSTAKGSGDDVPELTVTDGLISAQQLAEQHGVNDGRQYYYRRAGRLTAIGKYQGKCYYTPQAVESFLHYLSVNAVPKMVEPKAEAKSAGASASREWTPNPMKKEGKKKK